MDHVGSVFLRNLIEPEALEPPGGFGFVETCIGTPETGERPGGVAPAHLQQLGRDREFPMQSRRTSDANTTRAAGDEFARMFHVFSEITSPRYSSMNGQFRPRSAA